MCFEKFFKWPKGAICLDWGEILVHGNVKVVNLGMASEPAG